MKALFGALTLALAMTTSSTVVASETISADERSKIESIVHDYILNNPEILIEAQERLEKKYKEYMSGAIDKAAQYFINDENTPKFGNKNSKHYIIEFFDYNCGYCKKIRPFTKRFVKEKDALLVLVEYPILSVISAKASAMGIALYMQDKEKYRQYQDYLMTQEKKLTTDDEIKDALNKVGASFDELNAYIQKHNVQDILKQNLVQGQAIGVYGTPFIIVDGKAVNGAVRSYEDLESLASK